jgi:hypothetical protein
MQRMHVSQWRYLDDDVVRNIITIQGYGFYKSSGQSSSLAGVWLPFLTINRDGVLVKPPFAVFSSAKLLGRPLPVMHASYWFGDTHIVKLINSSYSIKKLMSRFGNLEALLISFALDEQAWECRHDFSAELGELIRCIKNNSGYSGYVEWVRAKFVLAVPDLKTVYAINNPAQLQQLKMRLQSGIKYHNNQLDALDSAQDVDRQSIDNVFPRFDAAMLQRISKPSVLSVESKLISTVAKDYVRTDVVGNLKLFYGDKRDSPVSQVESSPLPLTRIKKAITIT